MRYRLVTAGFASLSLAWAIAGCQKSEPPTTQDSPAAADHDARKPPQFDQSSGGNADMNQLMADAMRKGHAGLPQGHPPIGEATDAGPISPTATLPEGHPPIGDTANPGPVSPGAALPPNHPPINQPGGPVAFTGDMDQPEQMLDFKPPASWTAKPARPMTVAIYTLPKAGDAPADAELVISHYPGMKNIPLQSQVDRWALQFSQPSGQAAGDAVKQTKLEGAANPTTVVDIAGTYQAGSMMGPSSGPQENYRMLTAVIETEQGPWFFKLTGPKETVAAHEKEFIEAVRQAK